MLTVAYAQFPKIHLSILPLYCLHFHTTNLFLSLICYILFLGLKPCSQEFNLVNIFFCHLMQLCLIFQCFVNVLIFCGKIFKFYICLFFYSCQQWVLRDVGIHMIGKHKNATVPVFAYFSMSHRTNYNVNAMSITFSTRVYFSALAFFFAEALVKVFTFYAHCTKFSHLH